MDLFSVNTINKIRKNILQKHIYLHLTKEDESTISNTILTKDTNHPLTTKPKGEQNRVIEEDNLPR